MRKFFLCLLSLALHIPAFSQSPKQSIEKAIRQIEEFTNREFPPDSVFSNKPLGSFKEADLLRRLKFFQDQDQKLGRIDTAKLQLPDLINLELLKYSVREQLNFYQFKEYLNPILSDEGFHTGLTYRAGRSFSSSKEFKNYLEFLRAIPSYVNEQIALIRTGLKMGISQPVIALQGYANTYEGQLVDSIEKSSFFEPFNTKPVSVSENEWKSLVLEGKNLIAEKVIPSFRLIKKFFEEEYFPGARKSLGVSNYPNGKAYYEALVRHHTTTGLSPDQVYEIGMSEVSRIRKEMEDILKEVGFKGSFKEFFDFLRTDSKFYATSPEQLLKEASFIAKKIDGKLPLLFGKLPREPYGVEPVPDYLAPSYTSGRYAGTGVGSKNAGMYWVNTYNLKSRTLYTLEALTLHEAVPGHHLQMALSKELTHLPPFRRSFYVNAFGEGWGLYSEYLGTELGLYKDPYSRFGRFTYEMWRACRLVIDVGIHWKNWTKEEAVNFLGSNSALSLHEVNTEVNRYISWPGQALSYKIGEIKIRELRKKAEAELKDKFDIRSFHDLILSEGSVTLSILEKMVNEYIRKEKLKM